MLKIILYIAVSMDGFIADKDGGVSWLDKYNGGPEDCGYPAFYSSIDALTFGKNTYNQVVTFGDWPYPGKKSYIFADKDTPIAHPDVELVHCDIPTFIKNIEKLGVKRLWLMGGAQLVNSFYELGLIDEYVLAIIQDHLGTGIALREEIFKAHNLTLIDSINYPISGITVKSYKNA